MPKTKLDAIQWLAAEYHDLNGSSIETFNRPPSSLEFCRLSHISRPAVIRGMAIPAATRWTDEYMIRKMGDRQLSVAVTPNGRADAVTRGPDDKLYFAEPHTEKMSMSTFLSTLTSDSQHEAHYLQSQNGNLFSSEYFETGDSPSEFESLRDDVPSEIFWCSEALNKSPDAVNLWIGNEKSITSIHCDPYENIYTVVKGTKQFTLIPPCEAYCLKERTYPHAVYTRDSPSSPLVLTPSSSETPHVRWSSILDPHVPDSPHGLPPSAHPIHITLNVGDTLYLPPGWWHHVRQVGVTISLNWWWDLEMRGMHWVTMSFLREIGGVPPGNVDIAEE